MIDLIGQYKKIKDQIDKNLIQCIESGRLVNGPIISNFTNNLSKYLDVNHVIPCANGTDAIQIAFMALDLNPRSHDNYSSEKKYWDYLVKLYSKNI